jgi:hypothetical protein
VTPARAVAPAAAAMMTTKAEMSAAAEMPAKRTAATVPPPKLLAFNTKNTSNSIFRIFKEANKKLIIVLGSEKPLKDLENHQRIHRRH